MSFPLSCNYVNCLDIDKKNLKTGAEGVRSSVTGLEYLSELKWNESFWTTDKDMCTRSSHIRYLNPRLKYHSFHYISIHVISTIDCELTMACSPVGMISSMDIALRPVTAKVRVPFPVQPKFCQVLLQPLWLFIQLRRPGGGTPHMKGMGIVGNFELNL